MHTFHSFNMSLKRVKRFRFHAEMNARYWTVIGQQTTLRDLEDWIRDSSWIGNKEDLAVHFYHAYGDFRQNRIRDPNFIINNEEIIVCRVPRYGN